ncbi:MAG: protein kinase [Polyangiaceae bacterium]
MRRCSSTRRASPPASTTRTSSRRSTSSRRTRELFLVMEFVEGLSLAGVFFECSRTNGKIPLGIIGAITQNVLAGLHAAHEATTEQGAPLELIHRDVSPQNVLVGRDGVARVLDFGIAKAIGRSHTTREGRIKGKLAYMAPEQVRGQQLDRRADIYAASVMLWELLTMRRLYDEDDDAATIYKVVHEVPPHPRSFSPEVSAELDQLVMQGMSKDRAERFPTARAMAMALARAMPVESPLIVGDFLSRSGHDTLLRIASKVRAIESVSNEIPIDSDTVVDRSKPKHAALPDLDVGPSSLPNATDATRPDTRLPAARPSDRHAARASGPVSGVEETVRASFPELDLPGPSPSRPEQKPVTSAEPPRATAPQPAAPPAEAWPPPTSRGPEHAGESAMGAPLAIELDMPGRAAPSAPRSLGAPGPANARPAPDVRAHPALAGSGGRPPSSVRVEPPRRGTPISVYAIIGFVALGAALASLYLFVFKKSATPPASTSAGVAPPTGVEGACEASRKRMLRSNEDAGPFDTRGWVIELWLSKDDAADLGPSSPPIAELRGVDGSLPDRFGIRAPAGDRGVIELATLPAPPFKSGTENGVVVRFTGGYAGLFFDPNARGSFVTFADQLYERAEARIGALYARCRHLPFHDVGAWFKGADLSLAGDALGFILGGYAEGMWVSRETFDASGRASTSLQAFQRHRLGVDGDAFKTELRALGASVDDGKKGATIVFPSANPTRPISASQWYTKKAAL